MTYLDAWSSSPASSRNEVAIDKIHTASMAMDARTGFVPESIFVACLHVETMQYAMEDGS